jgi:hypothetical protein
LDHDYAIVARIHDSVTGQPVIILAGILGEGTEAAGELLSNPAYLDVLLQKSPKDWDQRNLEAVIETHVIEQHPGPPEVNCRADLVSQFSDELPSVSVVGRGFAHDLSV